MITRTRSQPPCWVVELGGLARSGIALFRHFSLNPVIAMRCYSPPGAKRLLLYWWAFVSKAKVQAIKSGCLVCKDPKATLRLVSSTKLIYANKTSGRRSLQFSFGWGGWKAERAAYATFVIHNAFQRRAPYTTTEIFLFSPSQLRNTKHRGLADFMPVK